LATALCEVGHQLLRLQPEVQLRHCEPQRILGNPGDPSCWHWRGWLRGAVPSVPTLEIAARYSEPSGSRIARGTRVRPVLELCRGIRADHMVHLMRRIARSDLSDQRAIRCGEGQKSRRMTDLSIILGIYFA